MYLIQQGTRINCNYMKIMSVGWQLKMKNQQSCTHSALECLSEDKTEIKSSMFTALIPIHTVDLI